MQRRDYYLSLAGLKLHVTEWGDPQGLPIVMLHGIRGYSDTFVGLATALQPEHRVIAIDQRGRGKSDWDPACNYYIDTYVDDLAAVADQLSLDSFNLLGHSLGGITAIVYAATYPHRVGKLMIEDAGIGAFENSAGAQRICRELALTPSGFKSWEAASAFMGSLRPTVSEQAREQRLKSMLKQGPDGDFTWRYDHVGIARTRLHPDPARAINLATFVGRIACPTLLLRGRHSDYLQPDMVERMCALNPCIQAVEIADAGHYVHDDQPKLFANEICSFLSRG